MKVAFYQSNPAYGKIKDNISKAVDALDRVNADLLVLPELFSTGYFFGSRKEAARLAERVPSGPTTRLLTEYCQTKGCAIVAGIAEAAGARLYNSAVLIGPRGFIGKYRKIHLFDQEKKWFDPGNLGFRVWEYKSARIGLMICFDWVFPEATRVLALRGADIVCHPSNLVLPYCHAAMVTRSIENRVFTVTANRVGSDRRGRVEIPFSGLSQITDPFGKILLRAPKASEKIMVLDIDPGLARNKRFTRGNNLFGDRRPEFYRELLRRRTAGGGAANRRHPP
jgi:predicted amidohydrolase